MRVFTCNDFVGHYPVGTAAVILADDEDEARRYLANVLQKNGLGRQDNFTIEEVTDRGVTVLCDGNY